MRKRMFAGLIAPAVAIGLAACTVEQTEEGRAPEIDPGEAPAYEIQPADVDLQWDTTEVRVPSVELSPADPTPPPDTTRP
ncbi:MAG TPA: hypothetical protein VK936_06995 [Longimicrobiales bacterium]|nr:hypothetical protein [Longimicrobiales bacterium]